MGFVSQFSSIFFGADDNVAPEEEAEMTMEREPVCSNAGNADRETRAREARITSSSNSSAALQMVLARPNDFSEVKSIGDDMNAGKTVLLNLETVKSDDARRILDFLSGVAYANDATIKMMAQKTFAIMPDDVTFSGIDLISELENNGYSF